MISDHYNRLVNLRGDFCAVRADVLISQNVEKLWRVRSFPGVDDVKWTYVGMRSGVFRTYPAHRSRRGYDPSKLVSLPPG